MEDKQLNLNQPFLSVRRYSSTGISQNDDRSKNNNSRPPIPRPPPYRAELKSGPIKNPGAVPFIWEQTPGRPKDEAKPKSQSSDKFAVAPKLPPGRSPTENQQVQQNSHKDLVTPVTSDNKKQDVKVNQDGRNDSPLDGNVGKFDGCKEERDERASLDSGNSDEEYVDAPNMLSRTESFFVNCSTSGLIGVDDLDVEPSGSFFTDPETREFMMDRFLPAAKAMASETTPQYAPKKQPVVREQPPREIKKIVNGNKPLLRYGLSFAQKYSNYYSDDQEDEEDSDEDYDQHGNVPAVCGLLPRFCLKGSLGLLNPVPALSVRTRAPMSPAHKIHSTSTSSSSCSGTNESISDMSEQKRDDKSQTAENKIRFREESGQLEVCSIPEETEHANGTQGNGLKTFKEFLADQSSPKEINSRDHAVEKILHVDTVHKVESPDMSFCSPTKQTSAPREEDNEKFTNIMDQNPIVDSSVPDLQKLDLVAEAEKLFPNACTDKSNQIPGMKMTKASQENHDLRFDLTSTKSENQQLPDNGAMEKSQEKYSQFLVPPPLPKSPTDSWLGRTLPSMSTKNASLRSYTVNPQKQVLKSPKADAKWENIVKSTHVRRQHLRYSEELLTPIPET